jgi:hypothetical protein
MAAPVLVSKLYCLPNSAYKGYKSSVNVSGCTKVAAFTGSAAQQTSTTQITITSAPAGTYASISTTLGSRSTINYNRLGTTPTVYHITAKTGNDASMVLTTAETAAGTDLVNRPWAIGGPFSDLVDATSSALPSTGGFDRVYCSNEGGADWYATSGQTIAAGSGTQASGQTEVEGYGATEGDNLPLIIQADCSAAVLTISATNMVFSNVVIKGQKSTYASLLITGANVIGRNIHALSPQAGATGAMIDMTPTGGLLIGCSADGAGVAVSSCISLRGSSLCAIGCIGQYGSLGLYTLSTAGGNQFLHCLSRFNSSHGISIGTGANALVRIFGCTSHGNGGSGIYNACVNNTIVAIINTIMSNNTRYGYERVASAYHPRFERCNSFGNTMGHSNDGKDITSPDGILNFNLDPKYANISGGNFSPGETMRALGIPGAFPVGVTTPLLNSKSWVDLGAVQREESGYPQNRLVNGV